MRRIISVLTVAAVIAAMMVAMAAPALGQEEGKGCNEVPEFAHDSSSQGPDNNTGKNISDGFYGNEPNITDPFAPGGPQVQEPGTVGGRVELTAAPGPFVNRGPNEPPRDDHVRGRSVGELNKEFCTH